MELIIIIAAKCDSCESEQFCAETTDDLRLCYSCIASYPNPVIGLGSTFASPTSESIRNEQRMQERELKNCICTHAGPNLCRAAYHHTRWVI